MSIVKKRLLLSLLIIAVIISVSGCGGKNSSSSTNTNTKTEEPKQIGKPYKFNDEQLAFFKSLGIKTNEITNPEIRGNVVKFFFDKEEYTVFLNEKNGIVEIYNCKLGSKKNRTLWNEKKGKIGMIRAEKLAFLDKFINTHSQSYDQKQDVTWVDSISKLPLGHKGIFTYMGIKGRDKKGQKWLMAKIHHCSDTTTGSSVSWRKVVFYSDSDKWTYTAYREPYTLAEQRRLHEYLDVPFEDIERGIELIAYGGNPSIDFVGHARHFERKCTIQEIENARAYLLLSEVISN